MKLILCLALLVVLVRGVTIMPDNRCDQNTDCNDPTNVTECCGFHKAAGVITEKGFTCMALSDIQSLNY